MKIKESEVFKVKNTMAVNVYYNNRDNGEQVLKRVYPCFRVFNSTEDSSLHVMYSSNHGNYDMVVECESWRDEYLEIEAI